MVNTMTDPTTGTMARLAADPAESMADRTAHSIVGHSMANSTGDSRCGGQCQGRHPCHSRQGPKGSLHRQPPTGGGLKCQTRRQIGDRANGPQHSLGRRQGRNHQPCRAPCRLNPGRGWGAADVCHAMGTPAGQSGALSPLPARLHCTQGPDRPVRCAQQSEWGYGQPCAGCCQQLPA